MSRKVIEKNISYDDIRKKYYVNFDYGKGFLGKRVKSTKCYASKKEAKNALGIFTGEKIQNRISMPTEYTVESWLDYWMKNVKALNCAETTLYGYQKIIDNHINPAIGKIKLDKVTLVNLNMYTAKMLKEKQLSPNTVIKHHNLLFEAFKSARKHKYIYCNPVEDITRLQKVEKEMDIYNEEEMKKLLKAVKGDRLEIVVLLAGCLGLRRGEIAGLKWENIKLNENIIYIKKSRTQAGKSTIEKTTKTESSIRALSFGEDIKNILEQLKLKQDEEKNILKDAYVDNDYLLAWEDGTPIRPNYISDLFNNFLAKNNLRHIRLHDCRHFFATVAKNHGVSLFDISKALGHSEMGITTKIYVHISDKTYENVTSAVSNSLF